MEVACFKIFYYQTDFLCPDLCIILFGSTIGMICELYGRPYSCCGSNRYCKWHRDLLTRGQCAQALCWIDDSNVWIVSGQGTDDILCIIFSVIFCQNIDGAVSPGSRRPLPFPPGGGSLTLVETILTPGACATR